MWRIAITIEEESMPPERAAPIGTSLRRCRLTEADQLDVARVIQRNLAIMRWRNLMNIREQRCCSLVGQSVPQVKIKPFRNYVTMTWSKLQQGLDFGSKSKTGSTIGVIERLNTEIISCQNYLSCLRIEEGKREHANESRHSFRSPAGICGQQDFCIGARMEAISKFFQLLPQLDVVIDLAVINHEVTTIWRSHRLPARVCEVKNGKPAVKQNHFRFLIRFRASASELHSIFRIEQISTVIR